jgi:hypothetical protein
VPYEVIGRHSRHGLPAIWRLFKTSVSSKPITHITPELDCTGTGTYIFPSYWYCSLYLLSSSFLFSWFPACLFYFSILFLSHLSSQSFCFAFPSLRLNRRQKVLGPSQIISLSFHCRHLASNTCLCLD